MPVAVRVADDIKKLILVFFHFSFLIIAVLFSAGNAKKNVYTVFIDPIVTIGVLRPEYTPPPCT